MELSKSQQKYVSAVIAHAPALGINLNKDTFSRAELRQVSMAFKGKKWIPNWITHDVSRRADRGLFTITEIREQVDALAVSPGHGTEGDDLMDTIEVSDDMGAHTVSDDVVGVQTHSA